MPSKKGLTSIQKLLFACLALAGCASPTDTAKAPKETTDTLLCVAPKCYGDPRPPL